MNTSSKKFLNSILCATLGLTMVSSGAFGYEILTPAKITELGLSPIQSHKVAAKTVAKSSKKAAYSHKYAKIVHAQKPAIRTAIKNSAGGIKLEGQILLNKGSQQTITLSLRDSDVQQVLRMMADKAGLNIIFDKSVTGKVTLDLVNVPLSKAFDYIMTVNDLNYSIDHNTMIVATNDAAAKIGIDIQQMIPIKVKYLDATNVANFLNKNIFTLKKPGLSSSQVAITNPANNEVLIFGSENDLKLAKKIISQLDTKPEMRTYKVNHITPSKMGELLCNTLFSTPGAAAAASSSATSTSTSTDSVVMGGGTVMCKGSATAAAGGSSSSGGASLESLKANSYSIIQYPDLGTISILGATPEQFNMAESFIKANDKKTPQVYIEMSIIELSEQGAKEFDNTWSSSNGVWTFDPSDAAKGGISTITNFPHKLSTGNISFSDKLQYIISNSKSRMLANPKIVTSNNKKTTINITDDYLKSQTVTFQTTAAGVIESTSCTVGSDAGIQIDLTPYISPDGYVVMNIKPTYKSLGDQYEGTAVDATSGKTATYKAGTLLHNRELQLNNIRVKDGNTLVIGGLTQDHETKSVLKIPVLGDIPGLGVFFRSTKNEKTKTELVILMTPKILKDDEDINALKKDTNTSI